MFPYPRLKWVENGFGARIAFAYESDGRADSDQLFYNYRVREQTIWPIFLGLSSRITYGYGTRCYDQTASEPYYTNGGVLCRGRVLRPHGPLVGRDVVTETVQDASGADLFITVHRFYIDDGHSWRLGREYQVQEYGPDGVLLRQQDRTWESLPTALRPLPAWAWR